MLPSHAYYQAVHGRWRGAFDFQITDRAAFRASSTGWLDRLRARLMAVMPKLVGAFVIDTSVDYETNGARGEVVHTTRISKWGMTMYDAVETFTLSPNGRDLAIARKQRAWPSLRHTLEVGESRGEVEPSGTKASYVFPFFGTVMRQAGSIEEGGVRILQETAWSRGEQLLVRRPS